MLPFTQQDPIGIAGGLNLYGYTNGDPVNFSDPYGLCPFCPGGLLLAGAGGGSFAAGAAAGGTAGASAGSLVPGLGTVVVGLAGAVAGGIWFAHRHRQGVDRVNTSLGIAAEHIGRIGGMPPDDEDPDFIRDMLNHAQKHLNNAKKYIRQVRGKTRDELQRQLDDLQDWVDNARGGN